MKCPQNTYFDNTGNSLCEGMRVYQCLCEMHLNASSFLHESLLAFLSSAVRQTGEMGHGEIMNSVFEH